MFQLFKRLNFLETHVLAAGLKEFMEVQQKKEFEREAEAQDNFEIEEG